MQYSGISRQFDTSGMAKICDGFTIGTVLSAINEVSRVLCTKTLNNIIHITWSLSRELLYITLDFASGNDYEANGPIESAAADAYRTDQRAQL